MHIQASIIIVAASTPNCRRRRRRRFQAAALWRRWNGQKLILTEWAEHATSDRHEVVGHQPLALLVLATACTLSQRIEVYTS